MNCFIEDTQISETRNIHLHTENRVNSTCINRECITFFIEFCFYQKRHFSWFIKWSELGFSPCSLVMTTWAGLPNIQYTYDQANSSNTPTELVSFLRILKAIRMSRRSQRVRVKVEPSYTDSYEDEETETPARKKKRMIKTEPENTHSENSESENEAPKKSNKSIKEIDPPKSPKLVYNGNFLMIHCINLLFEQLEPDKRQGKHRYFRIWTSDSTEHWG